jgi:hypothetical protein
MRIRAEKLFDVHSIVSEARPEQTDLYDSDEEILPRLHVALRREVPTR